MATVRKALSARQLEVWMQVRDTYNAAAIAFESAKAQLNTTSALLLDFHGFDESAQARVDTQARELVVELPDPPPAPPAAPPATPSGTE